MSPYTISFLILLAVSVLICISTTRKPRS